MKKIFHMRNQLIQLSQPVPILTSRGRRVPVAKLDCHRPVEKLRIFGSKRSAGSTVESPKFGNIEVELFDVDSARECDVVFLAVSGDFSLEHAEALSKGDDGAVVIDNSVRSVRSLMRIDLSTYLMPYFL